MPNNTHSTSMRGKHQIICWHVMPSNTTNTGMLCQTTTYACYATGMLCQQHN